MAMRIAFLSVSAEFGGSESALWQLVRGVRRLTPVAECVVIVPREGTLSARVRDVGASVRIVPMPDALASFGEWSLRGASAVAKRSAALLAGVSAVAPYQRALQAALGDVDPDVIHTNGFKMHVLGSRAAPRGAAVVWHLHEFVSNRPLSRRLLRHHAPRAVAIVANSRSVAEDARRALGDSAPVTHVHNAVDLSEFSPSGAPADLDVMCGIAAAPPGTIRVGLVATFARWKGHESYLRALAGVTSPVRAYVIGGPMYDTAGSQHTLEELRGITASLGLSDRVGFTGFVPRPAAAMRALDIVVHASTEPEPFGLVIAEALACGRAVIVSAAGGAAELVDDGTNAVTVVPGDTAALARAIDRLAGDPVARARLGAAGRASAVRRFDPDVFTRAFLDIYERAAFGVRTVTT
jgi:glycosyltransferase involved in cell wall biosynthesis